MKLTQAMRTWLSQKYGPAVNHKADADLVKLLAAAVKSGDLSPADLEKMIGATAKVGTASKPGASTPAKAAVGVFRVKEPSERYSTKKYALKDRHGQEVIHRGKALEAPSELEHVQTGVWLKHLAIKSRVFDNVLLRDHEKHVLAEMIAKPGSFYDFDEKGWDVAQPGRVKALLDDGTSGGSALNPIFFDTNIVTFPLLNGELYPHVDVQDMPRGRTVNTASVGNPSVAWGTAEGTAITPFTTTSLVAQIAASAFPVQVAVEVGRDLMADADPLTIGQTLMETINQRMLESLDSVIATGDGSTQPQGFTLASGLTAASSDNGPAGPLTVGDAEALIFALPKQYRQKPWNASFVMNDTSYRRFRSAPVGPTDERRVFGMGMMGTEDSQRYQLFEYPVRISQSLTNSQIAFACLKRYRMWRRMGFETTFTTEGNYLNLRNLALLVVRGRFAGKLIDSSAAAMISDAQS